MPHKNRKCKKKDARPSQADGPENAAESRCSTSNDHLQPKEIEQVATVLKSSDLSDVPLVISLTVLQKKDAISKLLKQGCNIDEFGPNRSTALICSVRCKNLAFAQFLLSNGADPSLEDQSGNNVLFQALEDTHWDETLFLSLWDSVKETQKLEVDRTNKFGTSLMHLAVKREWAGIIEVLVGENANVNVINSSGATPLMLAAFRYNLQIVEVLLQAGADVFRKDNRGRTALCYAIFTAIVKCLRPPYAVIDLLIAEMEVKGCPFEDYLKYVVDCSSSETLSHIVLFTVRYVPNGVKTLLEVDFFKVMLKSFRNHQRDPQEQRTLLMIVAEVLSHNEAAERFFAAEWPEICLETLKMYEESHSDAEILLLRAAVIHLLILVCGDTEEGIEFLRKNFEIIVRNYDRSLENYLLQKYEADDPRNQTVWTGEFLTKFTGDCVSELQVHHKIKLFKEQLLKTKTESEILQDSLKEASEENGREDETTIVTAIKIGVQKLRDELAREEGKGFRGKELENKELLFRQRSNPGGQKYFNLQTFDSSISYLEELLQKIVITYQGHWKLDRERKAETEKAVQDEILQMQRLKDRFKSLTATVREVAQTNLSAAQIALDQMENLLLQHRIRGKTIAEALPLNDSEHSWCFEETGDQLYYKEISLLSEKKPPDLKLQKEAQAKTMENKYHLIPSIMAICDDEDFEEAKSERKIILKSSMGSMSRWCSLLEKLHRVSRCEQLLGGDIRVCSRDKRHSYIISTSGNFNPVEIGLDVNSRPLAIKRIAKASKICRSLKLLINPLLGLRNTHILHYFACDYEENELILATPLCEYNIGEYMMYIRQNTQLPVLTSNMVVAQFLAGLKFLHEFKEPIVHGNLKPSNIFVDLHGVVRIAEFGIHRALFQLNEAPASSTIWFARETYETFKKTVTIECTRASDIHVSGMLLHFILTGGKHPYGEEAGEILSNLEKATPQISTCDMDLQDLITWMLLYDPNERPAISQVLTHVFFWSPEKRWSFILTCSGIGTNSNGLSIEELHTTINKTARKDDIKGSWVVVVKQAFPKVNCVDDDDTPTGLLRFIKSCYDSQITIDINPNDLSGYILGAFPALTLSLYRMLESTSWLRHPAFLPFIK